MERVLPAAVRVDLIPSSQGTRLAVITPPVFRREMIAFMGFKGFLSEFELQRFKLLAHIWEARILIPEVPGSSKVRTYLTLKQAFALTKGDYRPLARLMATKALELVSGRLDLHFLGYSMGCSLASATLASVPSSLVVSSLFLVEPVAIQPWRARDLLRASEEEDSLAEEYVAATLEWQGAQPAPLETANKGEEDGHHTLLARLLLANALRGNRVLRDLSSVAPFRPSLGITVAHAAESRLSPRKQVSDFIADLRLMYTDVWDLEVPGGHPFWHSLDAVYTLAHQVTHLRRRQ